MAQESVLRIVIDSRNAERNAHALANELESIEKKGDYATKSMDSMSVATRQLAGYMAGIVTIGAAINKMDTYTGINNKLKLVTNSQTELNQAMQDTFAIAQRSASSWGAVNDVYSKYMSNAKTLNLTQAQTARLTEITSKAVAISGSTTESAAGALFQYGQALDGNILRGEEYNALVDGAGGLLGAMAKGLNVTRGELRQMMLDGKLTGEVITKALLKAGDSVDELFNKTDITIGQSLTVLNDSVTKFVGEASSGSGAATVLAGSIRVLADNLDLIADGAIVLGIGYVTTAIATKTLAVKADIVATLGQRAATQAQAVEEVKLATAAANDAKAHLALTQATAAATQAKFGATAAATKYKLATDAVTQAVIRQEAAEKAAYGSTMNMSKASAGLLGFLGGPLGIGLTLATVAAGYMLMRDSTNKATAAIDIQGQSVDDLVIKYRELNTLQRDNETKALADQVKDLSLKFRVASSDLTSFMQALPVSDDKITTWSKLHSEFSQGRINSVQYYESIKALNILNDDQLNKVRGLIGGYDSSNIKMKEAKNAQEALSVATKKTTQDAKDQAVSVAKLSEEIKKLLRESNQNITQSNITSALASRGYNDTMIELAKKYLAVEGAIVKNEEGKLVLRNDLQKALNAEYEAIMRAKGAVDSRNEAEKETTNQKTKQLKITQAELEVAKRSAALVESSGLGKYAESKGIPSSVIAGLLAQESKGIRNAKSHTGAIGYFQTTSSYRKQNNMSVADSYDLEKSGKIAIDNIAKVYEKTGDLAQAILSHNAGEGGARQFAKTGRVTGSAERNKEVSQYVGKVSRYSDIIAGGTGKGGLSDGDSDRAYGEQIKARLELVKQGLNLQEQYESEQAKRTKDRNEEINLAQQTGQQALIPKIKERYDAQDKLAKLQQEYETEGYKWTEERKLQYTYETNVERLTAEGKFSEDQKKIFEKGLKDQYEQEKAFAILARETRIFQYKQALMTEAELVRERYRIEMLELSKLDIEERRIAMQAKTTAFIRGNLAPVGTAPIEPNNGKSNTQLLQEETGRELLAMQNRHLAAQVAAKDNANELLRIDREYLVAKEQLHAEHDIKLVDARRADHDSQLQLYGQMLSQASGVWSDMTQMIKEGAGENSSLYKSMFLAQQGMAAAQAIIYANLGSAAALAPPPIGLGPVAGAPLSGLIKLNGYASAALIAAQTLSGFETGGYTGSSGRKDVAGVVHGQEYVLNAAATKRVGVGTLDAINSGKSLGGGVVVQPQVSVVVENHTSSQVQTRVDDEGRIRVIVRDEVDTHVPRRINESNSKIRKAMERSTTATAKRA